MKIGRGLDILIRYVLLVLVALPNLYLFYFLFAPLTLFPVFFLLNLFYDAILNNSFILVNNSFTIEIIDACVAGSAYYLLTIFNLAIPKIKLKKRLKMLGFVFGSFLVLNILRIFLLSMLYVNGSTWFDFTHQLFWYLISIVFVIGIWFLEVKLFKIKQIPFYDDIKFLYKKSSLKK